MTRGARAECALICIGVRRQVLHKALSQYILTRYSNTKYVHRTTTHAQLQYATLFAPQLIPTARTARNRAKTENPTQPGHHSQIISLSQRSFTVIQSARKSNYPSHDMAHECVLARAPFIPTESTRRPSRAAGASIRRDPPRSKSACMRSCPAGGRSSHPLSCALPGNGAPRPQARG